MFKYISRGTSLWYESAAEQNTFPALKHNLTVDVAIIGAGIAGLTAAYLLKESGKKVAVFEKFTIGEGVSGFTTGKVTSQHGIIYADLKDQFGEETARLYGEANQAAIELLESIIKKEHISCGWRREDNYVFTEKDKGADKLKREAQVAASLGLPASYVEDIPLPIAIKGAVKFANQATFHVLDYLHGIAQRINRGGSRIFEQTKAVRIKDGEPALFRTKRGYVTATDVIYATNVPAGVIDHIKYGLYVYPTRSYIVAGTIDHMIDGMYINTGGPTHSFLPAMINNQPWMLVGGYSHFPGMSGPASGRYKKLERLAGEVGMKDIEYEWNTWDFKAYDELPMVGPLYAHSRHVYAATGFRKWGLTNGVVAAMILADQINEKENPWYEVYAPHRRRATRWLPKGLAKGIGFHK